MRDVALVVPTIRENSFLDFVKRWYEKGLFDVVDLYVMEDNPNTSFLFDNADLVKSGCKVIHMSWWDIDSSLSPELRWIIPRRSDTVRSYGYYRAWKDGYKYILTLDDDCYPCTEEDGVTYTGPAFVKNHIDQIENKSCWFNTLNSVKPRGIPFKNVGKNNKVILNHGLWTNVLDYDAPYQLANPIPERFSFDNQVVPSGMYFPMCGMNVMWKADFTVLMYHLLMGKRKTMIDVPEQDKDGLVRLPFDRFGDIWCGIFMKKIADTLRMNVTTGMPYIRHERASNPFTNLRKEANGIEVNEDLWQFVDNLELRSSYPETLYEELGNSIAKDFVVRYPKYSEHAEYFRNLGMAMTLWASLFKGGRR